MTVQSRHTVSYCIGCHAEFVRCADCGNNCCNGGSGRSIHDKDCDCTEAYEHQDILWKNPELIQFASDTRETDKENKDV
jgi:hypothetical protein